MGKRIVAETGAGQHGVASAATCALLGLPATVYMGARTWSASRQRRAHALLGARWCRSPAADQTLKDAIDEALRDWVTDPSGDLLLLGSAVGPHPYPYLVRELQAIIGARRGRSS
jgi:tryptophan synthase beta chain